MRDQPAAQRRLRPLPAAVPDLVYRPFVADVPNRPWASDTTEHRDEGPPAGGFTHSVNPPGVERHRARLVRTGFRELSGLLQVSTLSGASAWRVPRQTALLRRMAAYFEQGRLPG